MSKVVIIEDDPIIAKIYENKLRAEGNTVAVADNGKSGIELVKSMNAELVMVDLMLPDISGIEIIKILRGDPDLADLQIVAYSGADESVLAEASAANPTKVLSKNELTPKEIFDNVRELLEAANQWRAEEPESPEKDITVYDNADDGVIFAGRVLVVEDDPLISSIVSDIVKKAGFEPIVVGDGGKALGILSKDSNFAAGVFDVNVPKISGTDLLRYMRTEKRLMKIPVLVMTANETVRVQLDAQTAGASIFIPKPFSRLSFETLFKTLVQSVEKTGKR